MPKEDEKFLLDRPASPSRYAAVVRTARLLLRVVIIILVGLNAWWAWDSRPIEDLRTISAWVDHGRHEEARGALARHLVRSPHHGEARLLLAKVLAARKDLAGSVEQLHLVPYWSLQKPEALALEGRYDLMLDRARDAEAAWLACIEYDPRQAPADYPKYYHDVNIELISLYRVEGRLDEARATTWRLYERTTPANHPAILRLRLQTELLPVPPEKAAVELRRYVTAAPDDWRAARALARAEQALGHPSEADRLIRAIRKARPNEPDVLREWMAILQARGDRKGLDDVLARLPAADDRDAVTSKFRGIAREWAGDLAGAATSYLRATRLDPSEPDSWERLARVERALGRADVADRDRLRAQQVRDARAELRRAYLNDLRATRRGGAGLLDPSRMASLCATLGWTRDADAWSSLIPPD